MSEVLQLLCIDADLVDNKKIHYIATAIVEDMKPGRQAILHPAEMAEPGYMLPGICSATFELDTTEPQPDVGGDPSSSLEFIRKLNLDWKLDQDD